MNDFFTHLTYSWTDNEILIKAILVFWALCLIGFWGSVIYGLTSSLFNYFKIKLYGNAN